VKSASGANGGDYRGTEELPSSAAKHMDAYSMHFYTFPGGRWESKGPSTGFNEDAWAATLRQAARIDELVTKHSAVMDKYEATGDYGAPEYQAALFAHVYAQHLCRLDPWPEPAERALRLKHFNERIYNYLQGPNEFVITGKFKDWDRWTDLERIGVPTLVMGGRYDTMSPADVQREGSLIPKSRTHICPNGSHFSLYDDQADYMGALIEFLRDVEAGTFVPQPRTNG